MTRRGKTEVTRRVDALVAPFLGLAFSLVVAFIAPRFASWVGPLPAFSAYYFAYWPAWIALNGLSAVVHLVVDAMELEPREGLFWRRLDLGLSVASALSVLAGIVAMVVPAMHIKSF